MSGTPVYEQRYIHVSATLRMAWAELLLIIMNHKWNENCKINDRRKQGVQNGKNVFGKIP